MNKIAITHQNNTINYDDFNNKVNVFGIYLQSKDIKLNTMVALYLPRNIQTIIAIATLNKIKATFILFDKNTASKDVIKICNEHDIKYILSDEIFDNFNNLDINMVDSISPMPDMNNFIAKNQDDNNQHIAYINFTSGTTGIPKGVVVLQNSLIKKINSLISAYQIDNTSFIAQIARLSFDASISEIFAFLVSKSTLNIIDDAEKSSPSLLSLALNKNHSTHLYITPQLLNLLNPQMLPHLKVIISMGDKAIQSIVDTWASKVILINSYGPAEVTIATTSTILKPTDNPLKIGKALVDTDLYILDDNLSPLKQGEVGELYCASDILALGYLNNPILTKEKFLDNIFLNKNGFKRMYKTGDLAYFDENNDIIFVGRTDRQVKISGIRIELDGIEEILQKSPHIKHIAIVAYDNKLHAYIVPLNNVDNNTTPMLSTPLPDNKTLIDTIKNFAKEHLDNNLIPHHYHILNELPLSNHGKVDYKQLTHKNISSKTKKNNSQITSTQQTLITMWQEILQNSNISIDDDFFDLGGNSFNVIELISMIENKFETSVLASAVFSHNTIKKLAQYLDNEERNDKIDNKIVANTLIFHAKLDFDIIPNNTTITLSSAKKGIFVSGCTGFVGAYLIDAILKITNIPIYCLVRAKDKQSGKERIINNALKYDLQLKNTDNIRVIIGDLSQEKLGLNEQEYTFLQNNIDLIYHSGAMVNFVMPFSALKPTNIDGTKEIIKLAMVSKSYLNYISTLGIFGTTSRFTMQNQHYENEDLLNAKDFIAFDIPYIQTKWVADQLICQAQQQGLNATIIRPGYITFDSTNGMCNKDDFWSRLILGCMSIGHHPIMDNTYEEFIHINWCTQAIIDITNNEKSHGKIFHLCPNHETSLSISELFNKINQSGISINPIDFNTWLKKINTISNDHTFRPLLPVYDIKVSDFAINDYPALSHVNKDLHIVQLYKNSCRYDKSNTQDILGKQADTNEISLELIKKYMEQLTK